MALPRTSSLITTPWPTPLPSSRQVCLHICVHVCVCVRVTYSFSTSVFLVRALPCSPISPSPCLCREGNARFTVLTDRLIRMEYINTSDSGSGKGKGVGASSFEDRATLAFLNRNLPVPSFTHAISNGVLTITTSACLPPVCARVAVRVDVCIFHPHDPFACMLVSVPPHAHARKPPPLTPHFRIA